MLSARRLGVGLMVVGLSLLVSHCSRGQKGMEVRPLKSGEAARMQDAYDPPSARQQPRGKDEPLSPERQEALGDLLLENRQYESSLVSYLQILKRDPNRYDLRYKVGVILLLSGKLDAAQQELQQVVNAQPDMLEAREALGLVFFQEKKYGQASQVFQEVLQKDGQRVKTYHLLGITHLAAGNPREAVRVMERGVRLDDKNVPLLVALGQAQVQLKDYNKALLYLKKAQPLSPKNQKLNQQLGMALAGLKRYNEAFEAFLLAGDEAQAYNNIGVHYFLDGRYEDAAKCFQRALELRPTFYQEAKANLQRALDKMQEGKKDSL